MKDTSATKTTSPHGLVNDDRTISLRVRVSRQLQQNGDLAFVLIALLALGFTLSLASPYFLTPLNLTNVLLQASVLAIVSMGVTIVIISGNFDLSVGSGAGLVGVIAALVTIHTGSLALGTLAGLAVGLAIGLINGIVVTMFTVPSFIATLAMLVMARGAALAITNGQTIAGLPDIVSNFTSSVVGIPIPVWIAAAVFALLHILLRHSRLGVQIYAVGGNAHAARLAGLPVTRIRTLAFIISGLTFAVAGLVLVGRLDSAQPTSGNLLELYAVAAVVLGGTSLYGGQGSIVRTIIGVLIIAVIQNGLSLMNVNSDLGNVILGAVFILASASGIIRRRA